MTPAQGNGHERDKLHFRDDDVFILDMFGAALYPGDEPAKATSGHPLKWCFLPVIDLMSMLHVFE